MTEELRRTALYDLHVKHGAKMVPFAGYEMPVQYPMGVMQEHLHTRGKAGLFDVSHMGQVILRGSSYEATAMALEKLIPMDVLGLPVGRQRYGLLTNEEGGLRDDLMFANREDHIYMVVNAGCKEADIAYMRQHLEPGGMGEYRPKTPPHDPARPSRSLQLSNHKLTPEDPAGDKASSLLQQAHRALRITPNFPECASRALRCS